MRSLYEYIFTANSLDLPIIVGTECNKPGQRKVDDFETAYLRPLMKDFLKGADVLFGHTLLLRYADYSYSDTRAKDEFPDRKKRKAFFASVGALPVRPVDLRLRLAEETDREKNLDRIRDAAKAGRW